MTHFATADEPGDDHFPAQLAAFREFVEEVGRATCWSTRRTAPRRCRDPESHFDMVRCGVAIYGMDPFRGSRAHGLEPALSLHSWVASMRRLDAGESAGYGRRWRAYEPTWLATVPIGYGDGWRRGLTNNADVLIRGRRHPLVGAVSMDNVTVALGAGHRRRARRRGGADRAPGRRADPRRGGGAAARDDQLRGDDGAPPAGQARAGQVSRSWIVGGALRDELLGREVTDIDIAVEGDPGGGRARARRGGARPGLPAVRGVRRLARRGPWRRPRLRLRAATGRDDRGGPAEAGLHRQRDGAGPPEGGELMDPLGGRRGHRVPDASG